MAEILSLAHHYGRVVFGSWWPLVWILVKIHVILLPLLGLVTFLTLWERKVIGWMHARLGPNRVGPLGLMQPIADAFKLLLKEIIVPERADRFLFWLAPVLTIGPALAAWAVIPFGADIVLADVNAGLLFVMAITSIGVYGVIVAGWASNSKYALLGAVRASAQMISFGIPLGFVLVTVLLVSGSLNLSVFRFARVGFPVMDLDSAVSPVHHLYRVRNSGNGASSVRCGRGGIGNRGRAYGRIFRYGVRHVFHGGIRQYHFAVGHGVDHVSGRMARAGGLGVSGMGAGMDMAGCENIPDRVRVHLGARDVSAIPLRPYHAAGLESVHSGDAGVSCDCRLLDADTAEYLVLRG